MYHIYYTHSHISKLFLQKNYQPKYLKPLLLFPWLLPYLFPEENLFPEEGLPITVATAVLQAARRAALLEQLCTPVNHRTTEYAELKRTHEEFPNHLCTMQSFSYTLKISSLPYSWEELHSGVPNYLTPDPMEHIRSVAFQWLIFVEEK